MINLYLFVGSVVFYYVVLCIVIKGKLNKFLGLKTLVVLVLLCLPFNFNDYVVTVIGNAEGEKGVYSILSLYQGSKNGNTFTLLGIPIYQKAGKQASTVIGIPIQKAEEVAINFIGIGVYQNAEEVGNIIGISIYQKAKQTAVSGIGFAFYQKIVDEKDEMLVERFFGTFSILKNPTYP